MTGQNPSWSTISTLVNSMLGGAMLTLPILFKDSGVVTGIIVLIVSALISYKTCSLYILHMSPLQDNIEQTIRRLSGVKWQGFFRGLTGYYLVCLNIIYIQLIEDQGYGIIYYILQKSGHQDWIAPTNAGNLVFDRFSMQYMSLLSFIPLTAMTFIKDISLLIRLTGLGVISVFIYMIFIFYEFFSEIGNVSINDIPLFGGGFGDLAGTCAIAFTIHTVVNPIMKANKQQDKNMRDLTISYILSFLLYLAIGLMGLVAIINNKDQRCKQSITNCYLSSWQDLLVEISYLIGRITVFPCFFQIARTRVLEFHFGEVREQHFRAANLLFMGVSTLLIFLTPYISLDVIMNLVGSLICFFFIYLIPTKFHFDCLYKEDRNLTQSILSQEDSSDQQFFDSTNIRCTHPRPSRNKYVHYTFYGIVNLIGIAIGIFGIYQFFVEILTTKS